MKLSRLGPVRPFRTRPRSAAPAPKVMGCPEHWESDSAWITGGKTRSEYMFSELPQIADMVGAPTAGTA
jgi:hypothetical protein